MSIYDFLDQYVKEHDGKHVNRQNYYIDGVFVSYSTTICTIDGNTAKLNVKKYSKTTSKLQSQLENILNKHGYKIEKYEGSECCLWNYGYCSDTNKWTVKELKDHGIF